MRPHLCHRLSDLFVLFEFGTVPESRVDRGSGFLGGGEVYLGGGGGVREGVVCRNLRLFGQRSSVQATKRLIKEFLEDWTVLFLLIPENTDTICWHKLRSLRTVST